MLNVHYIAYLLAFIQNIQVDRVFLFQRNTFEKVHFSFCSTPDEFTTTADDRTTLSTPTTITTPYEFTTTADDRTTFSTPTTTIRMSPEEPATTEKRTVDDRMTGEPFRTPTTTIRMSPEEPTTTEKRTVDDRMTGQPFSTPTTTIRMSPEKPATTEIRTADDRTTFTVPTTTFRTTRKQPTTTEIRRTSHVPITTDALDTLDKELENLANVSIKYYIKSA